MASAQHREGAAELAIITNRAPDPADPLISGRDCPHPPPLPQPARAAPDPRPAGPGSVGKDAGLTETELIDLLAVLDFDLARDRRHLEETSS